MPGIAGMAGKTDSSQPYQIQVPDLMLGAMAQDWYELERHISTYSATADIVTLPDSISDCHQCSSVDRYLTLCISVIYTDIRRILRLQQGTLQRLVQI